MIVQKHEAGESVLNLCKDFNLKEGTVYPWIKQYSKSGITGTGKTNTVMNIIKDSLLHGNQLLYVNGKGNLGDTKQVIEYVYSKYYLS